MTNSASTPVSSRSPGQPVLSVIVPLYNEEDNVALMQKEIADALDGIHFEIVLVDDGSKDNTLKNVVRNDHTVVIEMAKNMGQSAAMYAGVMAARGEYISLIDGDLQNDPKDLPRLLEGCKNGVDLMCGYRATRKDTTFKRIQSRVANFVRSRFTGDGVRDTGCSLKCMRAECRDALLPFTGMHRFIPALIKGAGYRVEEIAVNHRARQFGQSKYGFGNRAWVATMDMFGVRWIISRRFIAKTK